MARFSLGHFDIDLLEQSCGLIFTPPEKRFSVIFSLSRTAERDDVRDLIIAAYEIVAKGSDEGICRSWAICKDSLRGVFCIEFRGTRLFLGLDEINEFLRLVGQLSLRVISYSKDNG